MVFLDLFSLRCSLCVFSLMQFVIFGTNPIIFQRHLTKLSTYSDKRKSKCFLTQSILKPAFALFTAEQQISYLVSHEECRPFHRNMWLGRSGTHCLACYTCSKVSSSSHFSIHWHCNVKIRIKQPVVLHYVQVGLEGRKEELQYFRVCQQLWRSSSDRNHPLEKIIIR